MKYNKDIKQNQDRAQKKMADMRQNNGSLKKEKPTIAKLSVRNEKNN